MSTAQLTPAELIDEGQGLVRSLAAKIHRGLSPRFELDDLVGYGQVGLAEAACEFDPAQGCRFTTFAFYRVRGAIYDGLSKMSWTSRARYNRLRYEQMVNLALREEQESQGSTSESQLLDDARWLQGAVEKLSIIFLSFLREEGTEDESSQIEDSQLPPSAVAASEEISRKLNELIDLLPPDERLLIRATYFEGQTLQEAAERLQISKSWASRLHAKTLESLARSLRRMGVDD